MHVASGAIGSYFETMRGNSIRAKPAQLPTEQRDEKNLGPVPESTNADPRPTSGLPVLGNNKCHDHLSESGEFLLPEGKAI